MKYTRLLLIRFSNTLSYEKIEYFRGAIVNALTDKDILFHNHLTNGNGYRYSYPLIQYKRINKQAAILCLANGTEAIGKFFLDSNLTLTLNGETELFEVDNIRPYQQLIQIWDSKFHYRIRRWLPFNKHNYEQYNKLEGIVEQTTFLERILTNNILSFAKGLNIYFENQVECTITQLTDMRTSRYKGTLMSVFDAEFITNVSIPDFAGLGKGVSIGYGVTTKKEKHKN